MKKEENEGRQRAAWSPTGIAVITVVFSPFVGGILHALNYPRLGKPRLQRLALASNLLAASLLLLAAYSSRWHVWALSLFVAAYFFKSQDQLFRQHRSTGGRNASWLLPGILAITVPLILAFGLFFAESLRNQARFQAACRLTEEGRYAEAEREFRACQKFSPDDAAIFWNLALIYENLGDIERAKKELRASLARYPNSTEVQEYLAELEARKPELLAGERPPG